MYKFDLFKVVLKIEMIKKILWVISVFFIISEDMNVWEKDLYFYCIV